MVITRAIWSDVAKWNHIGVPWGIIDLPDGNAVASEFVYYVFEEGFHFIEPHERLEEITIDTTLTVSDFSVSQKRRPR